MKGRFDHLKDFKKNSDGSYEYVGETYICDRSRKSFTVKTVSLSVAAFVCVIVCGVIPAKGMLNTFYVMLPLLLEIIFSAIVCYKTVRLSLASYPVRQYEYKKTVVPMPYYAVALAAFSAIRLVSYIVYLCLNAKSEMIFENESAYVILLLTLNSIIMITSIYIAISFGKSRWTLTGSQSEEKSDNK